MPKFPSDPLLTDQQIDRAAEILRRGGLVGMPTETVYGLAGNALDKNAIRRIFEAKGRPSTSPLIVHVANVETARKLSSAWPPLADQLTSRFWPGPLTIILPKAPSVPDLVTAGLQSVALRLPAHPIARELLRRVGVPLAAPSANRFMQISPTTAEHVRQSLGSAVDFVLDGGPSAVGIESTVVSLVESDPVILRPGMITAANLEQATGLSWMTRSPQTTSDTAHPSPGLHARHYAPRTPLYLLQSGDTQPAGRGELLDMPSNPVAFAEALYSELRRADERNWDWIAISEPPDTPEWAAIRDRLGRARTKL